MLIPTESVLEEGAPKFNPNGPTNPTDRNKSTAAERSPFSFADETPEKLTATPDATTAAAPVAEFQGRPEEEAFVSTEGTPAQMVAKSCSAVIAENPEAVWYVRPQSGGQYGPAKGDLFQRWIDEGRVSGDSLIWREDWQDWQSASAAFIELAGEQFPVPTPAITGTGPVPDLSDDFVDAAFPEVTGVVSPGLVRSDRPGMQSQPVAQPKRQELQQRRKKKKGMGIAVVVTLVLLTITLVGVLIWVVRS
ncbi:MAG: DUF4339 domain-containing protein [Pirellulaceae bacterium]|nr:DUF4339 domain-containing protein [Pirellulaceae bacterium]